MSAHLHLYREGQYDHIQVACIRVTSNTTASRASTFKEVSEVHYLLLLRPESQFTRWETAATVAKLDTSCRWSEEHLLRLQSRFIQEVLYVTV